MAIYGQPWQDIYGVRIVMSFFFFLFLLPSPHAPSPTTARRRDRSDRSSNNMPRNFREWDIKCKVYVGNLGSSASKHEIEGAFQKYGQLRNVWVARNPPGFAFVEYEDSRDVSTSHTCPDDRKVLIIKLYFY
jgi:RNA recognition motif. (a.k.a. RRM, RBD, or RNP domain)